MHQAAISGRLASVIRHRHLQNGHPLGPQTKMQPLSYQAAADQLDQMTLDRDASLVVHAVPVVEDEPAAATTCDVAADAGDGGMAERAMRAAMAASAKGMPAQQHLPRHGSPLSW